MLSLTNHVDALTDSVDHSTVAARGQSRHTNKLGKFGLADSLNLAVKGDHTDFELLPDIGGVVPYLAQKVLYALVQLRNRFPSH